MSTASTPATAPAPTSRRLARPTRLVPAVVEGILTRIVEGEFAAGDALPTESDLVDEYGVSRTVVREALRVLEEKGLITIQQGRPTTVLSAESWNLLDPLVITARISADSTLSVLDDLARVRAAVEAEMARVGAMSVTDDQLDRLGEILQRLAVLKSEPDAYLRVDREFHDVILEAAGNPLARQIVRNVHTWKLVAPRTPDYDAESIHFSHDGHTAIFEALAARDPDAAAHAMREHILGSWEMSRARIVAKGGAE